MSRIYTKNKLMEYISDYYPSLNADEIIECAESGLTMAEDIANDKLEIKSSLTEGGI